jgi:hypothetical protein
MFLTAAWSEGTLDSQDFVYNKTGSGEAAIEFAKGF